MGLNHFLLPALIVPHCFRALGPMLLQTHPELLPLVYDTELPIPQPSSAAYSRRVAVPYDTELPYVYALCLLVLQTHPYLLT